MKKSDFPAPKTPYTLGMLLLVIKTVTSFSNILPESELLDDILSLLDLGCFALSILQQRPGPKRLVVYAAVILVTLWSCLRHKAFSMLLTVAACLAFTGKNQKKSVRFLLFWSGLCIAGHTAASVLLWVLGRDMYTVVNGELRFNFGFSHPNVFSVMLVNLLFMWAWLRFETLRPVHLFVIVLIAAGVFLVTGTRTMLLIVILFVLLTAAGKYFPMTRKWIRRWAKISVPLVATAELLLWKGFSAGNSLALLADDLLSWRIRIGSYVLEHFGLTFLGRDVGPLQAQWSEMYRLSAYNFDDVYSYLMTSRGTVWLLTIAVLCFLAARRGSLRDCVFIILWTLYGMMEVHVLNPGMFFIILLVTVPWKRKRSKLCPKSV